MNPIISFGYLFCLICIYTVSDFQTLLSCTVIIFTGNIVSYLVLRGKAQKLYRVFLLLLLLYVTACYIYMKLNGYSFLLAFDTINVFIPTTENYLAGNSINEAIKDIWQDYNVLNRLQVGFYTFLVLIGGGARFFDADIYLSLQIGLITLCASIPVLIYYIFSRILDLSEHKSETYALSISVFSSIFFYSANILRDGMIAVLIVYTIYLMLKHYSNRNLAAIILNIFIISTLRIETGLMMISFIPFYFYIIKKDHSYTFISIIVAFSLLCFALQIIGENINGITQVFDDNRAYYVEGIENQTGIIGALQKLPFGISHFLSIIYTMLNPVPFWMKMDVTYNAELPECYNIMLFPTGISAFFNTFIIVIFVMQAVFHTKIKQNTKKLKIILIPVLISLFLQAAVVEQRRVIGLYAIIYIFAFLYYVNMNSQQRNHILMLSTVAFLFINIIGLIIIS